MPANLTPQYLEAERRFREAQTDAEKIDALKEMLRLIPKHKGTDHLQGDLKRRLSKLQDRVEQGRKSTGKRADPFAFPRHGAGRVVLVGMPNSGKSSIAAALTNAPVKVAEYPFSTALPVPGMMTFEDVQVQLVDTPPLTPQGGEPGLFTLARQADLAAVVVDLGSDDLLDHTQAVFDLFEERKLLLRPEAGDAEPGAPTPVKAVFIRTKLDLDPDGERRAMFDEFFGDRLPRRDVSAVTAEGLGELPKFFFDELGLIRVYTRAPGKKDRSPDPFVLKRGDTVLDLAREVHQDLARNLQYARIWGEGAYPGQSVSREHVLHDKDVVELHA